MVRRASSCIQCNEWCGERCAVRGWGASHADRRSRAVRLTFRRAIEADTGALLDLRRVVAGTLTARYGTGHWSGEPTEKGIRYALRISQVWTAWRGRSLVGTFRLATKKPWAIDRSRFTPALAPLYLSDMAVRPDVQRHGIGRRCLERVATIARAWPADAIRLDAYDADAGAGPFYERCGFREVGRASYRGVPLVYYELLVDPPDTPRSKRSPR